MPLLRLFNEALGCPSCVKHRIEPGRVAAGSVGEEGLGGYGERRQQSSKLFRGYVGRGSFVGRRVLGWSWI